MSHAAPPPGRRPRPATPTDVSQAIARRRRIESRRRTLALVAACAVLAFALVLVWLVQFSPVLAARRVEVRGTKLVGAAQVEKAAQVPLGTPLVRLDEQAVAQRVADAIIPAASVEVRTKLPSTVVVEVTERGQVVEREAGGRYQWVDAAGVIFHTADKRTKGVPVARTSSVDARLLADVATVAASLPAPLRARVQQITAGSPDKVELQLDKGQRVLWGSAQASAQKAEVLQVLLGQQATVFDVSSPGSPSTR